MKLARQTFSGPAGAPLLLLIHGVTRCGQEWEQLIPPLARDWRVTALDQRGHGASPRAESYLVMDYVDDAVQLVREELREPVVVLGHSLGAMVAAALAAEAPEFVRGMVLEDPPYHTMGNRINGSAWQAQFQGMHEAARRGGTVEELTDSLAGIWIPTKDGGVKRLGELRDRASLQWSATCLAQLDPEVLTPIIEGRWLDGYETADILPRISCPVLLLQGDPSAGGALTDEDARFALHHMTHCRLQRFPGVSHQIHRTQPEAVLLALREFTSTLLPPASPFSS